MREGDEVNIASQLGHIAIALRRWQRDLQPPSVGILSGTLPAVENGNVCLARVDSQVPRRNGDSYVEELVELEDIKELQRGSYIVFKVHNPAQSYVAGVASMGSRAEHRSCDEADSVFSAASLFGFRVVPGRVKRAMAGSA